MGKLWADHKCSSNLQTKKKPHKEFNFLTFCYKLQNNLPLKSVTMRDLGRLVISFWHIELCLIERIAPSRNSSTEIYGDLAFLFFVSSIVFDKKSQTNTTTIK